MSSYRDTNDFSRFLARQRFMGIMGGNLSIEDMIRLGILIDPCRMHEDDEDEDLSDSDVHWECEQHRFKWDVGQQNFVSHTQRSRTVSTAELNDHQWDLCGLMDSYPDSKEECKTNFKPQPEKTSYEAYMNMMKEAERKRELLEEKNKLKAEKKRLKKQRQKEKKRLQKELDSASTQDKEMKDMDKATLDKAGDEPGDDKTKDCLNLKDMATALESDGSDDSSDGSTDEEIEGLDLTSCFVTKAAEIVKRQLEQKEQKQDNKEKKKSPVKEDEKMPEQSTIEETREENCEENHMGNQETSTSGPKMEDFVKMSTELATIGNKQAAAGNFKLAVKYFTDAIKFNPTEYRLFGNRAFCFEKIQEFDKALNDAELSLSMSPGWVKGLFRKGRALAGLKRYEEAASAFKEVIKLDSACAEANQELVRMQILQLMEYGFTQDQCSKALIIHGSVDKAREFLSKFKNQSVAPIAPQQVVNMTGLSPILSAKMTAAAAPRPPPQDESKTSPEPLIVVQSHHTLAKPIESVPSKPSYHATQSPELFPIWVGNISFSATESLLSSLFNKIGTVFSMKHLPAKRCAFINFTKQQDCEEAIRRYHGHELLGSRLAVRYPDRMPPNMNISKSAHKAHDLAEENFMPNTFPAGRTGYNNYRYPYKY